MLLMDKCSRVAGNAEMVLQVKNLRVNLVSCAERSVHAPWTFRMSCSYWQCHVNAVHMQGTHLTRWHAPVQRLYTEICSMSEETGC